MHTLGIKSTYTPHTMGVKHTRASHTMGSKAVMVLRMGPSGSGIAQVSGLDTRENLDAFDPMNIKPDRGKTKKSNLEK